MPYNPKEPYAFRGYHIPTHMMVSIQLYINHGYEPGSFLRSVFENDFRGAVGHADDINIHNLPAYAGFLYNEAPCGCHGSPAIVKAWLASFESKEEHVEMELPS